MEGLKLPIEKQGKCVQYMALFVTSCESPYSLLLGQNDCPHRHVIVFISLSTQINEGKSHIIFLQPKSCFP